jgi:hypothetical protein
MSVGGEVTTYTLDYAGGGRVLLETGGAFAKTKHYLYGLECIGELVNADEPESEWRYYHQDGNHLVRQTTNIQATVTLAWTYSPEGAIILGEEGPVTHLGCEGNTTYDFSTGLIFKNGRYFDPNTGIWLTLSGMVVYQAWVPWKKRDYRDKRSHRRMTIKWLVILLLLVFILVLAGCGPAQSSTQGLKPTETPCPTPTLFPTFDPVIPLLYTRTPVPTSTPTLTPTPIPTGTRIGSLPTSAIGIKIKTASGDLPTHRGTVIGANAILTSDHWHDPVSISDITQWELVDAQDDTKLHSSGIHGTGSDIQTEIFQGRFGIIVFKPTLGNLESWKAQIGDSNSLHVGDELEQAVVKGVGNPGMYLTRYIQRDSTGKAIQVVPDHSIGGDSGMGLFKNGLLYGANVGGAGWYGAINNTGEIYQQIAILNSRF